MEMCLPPFYVTLNILCGYDLQPNDTQHNKLKFYTQHQFQSA